MTIASAPEDRMTEAERAAAQAAVAAWTRGDNDTAAQYARKIRSLPESLLAQKKTFGADFIRKQGYNTVLAEKYYGKDWLDRDE